MVLLFTTVLREMKMKPQTVPVAVKLPLDVRNRLKAVAENQDRSMHWLMREAVNQFLEREEQKALDQASRISAAYPDGRPTKRDRRELDKLKRGWQE